MSEVPNRRILVIDDTPSIHEDFRKILGGAQGQDEGALADARAGLFEESPSGEDADWAYEVESAYQGWEALERVLAAQGSSQPFAMAFVDIRMPPGWDGVETIKQLWKVDPDLQVVICTAYSDYSWEQTVAELGRTEKLLILKKPFDPVEIRQLACAMTATWNAARRERRLIEDLKGKEAEARAYASSLETMNKALLTEKASSERSSERKTEFLVHLSTQVSASLSQILERVTAGGDAALLEPVIDSSRDLMATLDSVLDLTRLEAGELVLRCTRVPVVELVRGALDRRRAEAEATGLALGLELATPVPEAVECDGDALSVVLEQLVDNALRYTPSGGVRVALVAEPTPDWARTRLVLTVSDDGPGVPEQDQRRMFEPFVGRPGAGLGLALAHRMARLMGGELRYERGPGGGACFRLTVEVGNLSGVRMVEG